LEYHIIIYIISHRRPETAEPSQSWNADKTKLKVKVQSVSDYDVRNRLLEKPQFELAAKMHYISAPHKQQIT